MKKSGCILFVIVFTLVLSSCTPIRAGKGVESVSLICSERAMNVKCVDLFYDDKDIIKTFLRAIESATKMEGVLDYQEEYEMTLKYVSGKERKFHLSITENRDYKGLLLELPDTMQGYAIPKDQANQLRDIIYK